MGLKNKKSNKKIIAVTTKKDNFGFLFKPYFVFIILNLLTLFIYRNSLNNEIVFLDDDMMFDNLKVLNASSYHIFSESIIRDAMVGIGGDLYRPVQTFSLILLYKIGGGDTFYFHFFQLFLHAVGCFLIFILLSILNVEKHKALLLTITYTLHPLFTPLLAFIPAIGDQLLLILGISSFISFIYYLKNKRLGFLVGHIILFILAVFTKETAIVFPAIFITYFLFLNNPKPIKKLYIASFFWIVIPIFYIFIRQKFVLSHMIAPHNVLTTENITHNILYNFPSFFEYITKFFFPFNLSFLASFNNTRLLIGIIIIVLIFVLFFLKKINYKHLILCFVWYSVFIFPPMLYHNPVFDYGEHRGFLPLVSMLFLLASIQIKAKYHLILLFIIPLFAFMSYQRQKDFKDPISFYNAITDAEPVPIAYLNRGAYIHKHKKDIKKVLSDYNKAIEIKKDYATALYNRAILKSEDLKDFDGAFDDLKAAISVKPNYADAFYHRGYLKLTVKNDFDGALSDIDSAIILNPNYVLAHNNRGIIKLSYFNDTLGAFNDFEKSIALQSISNPTPFFYRGLYHFWHKDMKKACKDWSDAKKQGHAQAGDFIKNYCIDGNDTFY